MAKLNNHTIRIKYPQYSMIQMKKLTVNGSRHQLDKQVEEIICDFMEVSIKKNNGNGIITTYNQIY